MTPTATKNPQTADRLFIRFISDTLEKRALNGHTPIDRGAKWQEEYDALVESYSEGGLVGFNQYLSSLLREHPYLTEWLSAPDPDQDARTRIDSRGKRVFRTMSMDDIDELPEPKWLIPGILQEATVSLIYGDSNVGKTFNSLKIAFCKGYGIDWLGREVKAGKVLYIYAEGIRGLKRRIHALLREHQLEKSSNIQFIGFPVHVIEERETLLNTISMYQGIELVVIDTISNCSSGINQNDQMEIQKVFATAHEIVRDYGCHVLVVHHTNNTGKFNGSAAFKNHVDTMIELKHEGKSSPKQFVMHCEKQRDDDLFPDMSLDLKVVELWIDPETLQMVTSCVVVASDRKSAETEAAQAEDDMQREKMLGILRLHKCLTVRKWIEGCKQAGISKRAFYDHIEYLKEQNLVRYEEPAGKGKPGYYQLVSSVSQHPLSENGDDNR